MPKAFKVSEPKLDRKRERVGNVTSYNATSGWFSCYKNDNSITKVFAENQEISRYEKNLQEFRVHLSKIYSSERLPDGAALSLHLHYARESGSAR